MSEPKTYVESTTRLEILRITATHVTIRRIEDNGFREVFRLRCGEYIEIRSSARWKIGPDRG